MARVLFFVLLLLNGVVAAGLAGLLGSREPPRGESERLTNQLKPEAIRWLSLAELAAAPARPKPPVAPPAASPPEPTVEAPPPEPAPPPVTKSEPAPAPVPMACVRFIGLDDARSATLMGLARDASPDLAIDDRIELVPTSWWVHIPPEASRRDAERRVTQIRARGINDLFILLDEGPFQYAISLGLFKTEASARIHLGRLEAKGVEGGVVTARGSQVHSLELRGPADALATFASDSAVEFPDLTREACAP